MGEYGENRQSPDDRPSLTGFPLRGAPHHESDVIQRQGGGEMDGDMGMGITLYPSVFVGNSSEL